MTGTPPAPAGQQAYGGSECRFRLITSASWECRFFAVADLVLKICPGEKGTSRSIIIDESFAQKYFAGKDPIGQHIDDNETLDEHAPPMTIVGVVPRTRNEAPGELNAEALHLVQEYLLASHRPAAGKPAACSHESARRRSHCGRGEARSASTRSVTSRSAQHHDHGRGHRFEFGDAPFDDGVVRRVCRARASARERGSLRRDGARR